MMFGVAILLGILLSAKAQDEYVEPQVGYQYGMDVKVTEPGNAKVILMDNQKLTFEVCPDKCRNERIMVCFDPEFEPETEYPQIPCVHGWCVFHLYLHDEGIVFQQNEANNTPPYGCDRVTMVHGNTSMFNLIGETCQPKIGKNNLVELNIRKVSYDCSVVVKNAILYQPPKLETTTIIDTAITAAEEESWAKKHWVSITILGLETFFIILITFGGACLCLSMSRKLEDVKLEKEILDEMNLELAAQKTPTPIKKEEEKEVVQPQPDIVQAQPDMLKTVEDDDPPLKATPPKKKPKDDVSDSAPRKIYDA